MTWHKLQDLEYNPFWREFEGMSKTARAFNQGYDEGYKSCIEAHGNLQLEVDKLKQKNESLRGLLGANLRVLKSFRK